MASKFIDLLRQVQLPNEARGNKRYAIPGQITSFDVSVATEYSLEYASAVKYQVGANLSTMVLVPDYEAARGDVRTMTVRNIQRQIAQEIYGPVRDIVHSMWSDLHELKQANSLRDWNTVQRLEDKLNQILEEIEP